MVSPAGHKTLAINTKLIIAGAAAAVRISRLALKDSR
jgi:hypothetical protein